MASSAVELLTPIVTLIRSLDPSSVLDIGVGFGKWGFLCREYLEVWKDRVKKDEWEMQIDGVEIFPETHDSLQPYLYNRLFYKDAREFEPDKVYDLVMACDVVEHMPKQDGLDLIQKMSSSWASNCIVSLPLGDEWMRNCYGRNPHDAHEAVWNDNDLGREWQRIKVTVPGGRQIGIFFKGSGFDAVENIHLARQVAGLTGGRVKSKHSGAVTASGSRTLSRVASFPRRLAKYILKKLGRKAGANDGSGIPREDSSKLPRTTKHMGRVVDKFKIKEAADEPGGHNILWDGEFALKTLPVRDAHNTQSGDCFIVGTGPSVNDIDFARLKGQTCFGVNGAIAKFLDTGLEPEYYAISTYDFFENRFDMVREAINSGAKCFFPFWGLGKICEQDASALKDSQVYLLDPLNQRYDVPAMGASAFDKWASNDPDMILNPNIQSRTDQVGFCTNMEKGYFHGENIVYTALQHAYYLGFRRIFILGMDLNYSGPQARFYEDNSDIRPTWIDASFERSIVPCFEIVRDMLAQTNIEVYNLSAKSKLSSDIIPKISFEEALDLTTIKGQ
jgi:Kdo-III transferase WaaZ